MKTDDPVSSNVRYTGEIVRIFNRRCGPCHSTDSLAMPLTSYREVRDWGRAIREEIVEQRMPPWSAARGYARFQSDVALTAREATTILSWLDGGMPRGDDRDLPKPSSAHPAAKAPDRRLTVPAQHVPALDEHLVRRVAVDTNLDAPRSIEPIVVNPGRSGLLRGALVFAGDPDRGGRFLGAWLPWQTEVAWPDPHVVRLPTGARLTVELHYRGTETETIDQPTIDLYFTNAPQKVVADSRSDDLIVRSAAPVRLVATTKISAVLPTADSSTRSLELSARKPNGVTEVVLWIPEYRHEWPQALILQEPMTLPAGTTFTVTVEPAMATASARLSLLPAAGASRATRSPARTPALQRK